MTEPRATGALEPERIILIGMMGAGKTTVGRALSARTGWPYVDNDDLVTSRTGRLPADIRASDGEDVLHVAEEEAFDAAISLEPPVVVSAAAAVVLDPAAREAVREAGHVVWLRARPETLTARMGSAAGRRAEATDPAWVRARTRERDPLYAAVAGQVVDVDERTPDEIVGLILAALSAR